MFELPKKFTRAITGIRFNGRYKTCFDDYYGIYGISVCRTLIPP